tara:strand:- start:1574 stop:1729 length:156 start_codon:yes stop_codon:yes gene_type:complete
MDPKNPTQPSHEEEIAFRDAERAMGRSAMRTIELFEAMTDLDQDEFLGTDL